MKRVLLVMGFTPPFLIPRETKKLERAGFIPPFLQPRETEKLERAGFTLMELMIVVMIIGILAVLVIPNYNKTVEHAKGKEAISNLKLIAAAERIYYLENNNYYPNTLGTESDLSDINANLNLDIPNEVNWDYWIFTDDGVTYELHADRQGSGPYFDCYYIITIPSTSSIPEPDGFNCP